MSKQAGMGVIYKSHNAWEAAKWICLSYLLSFVSGWLTRELTQGKISADNKAALFFLLATVLTLVIILCTAGMRRWKKGELSTTEKRLMVLSLVMYPFFFVLGWFTDIG